LIMFRDTFMTVSGGEWTATCEGDRKTDQAGLDHVCQQATAPLSLSSPSQMASNTLRQVPRSFRTNACKRFYSTTPPSTQQSAEQLQKKVTEFAASAQESLNKAWGVTKKSLGPFGERLTGALGCKFGMGLRDCNA
jgi:hypothetical protein